MKVRLPLTLHIVLIWLLSAWPACACEKCYHWTQPQYLAEITLQTKALVGILVVGGLAARALRALKSRRQAG